MYIPYVLHAFFLVMYLSSFTAGQSPMMPNIENLKNLQFGGKERVSPCSACRDLVNSFLKAVEGTTRQSFEGGDADWERQKLGSYENSELRFIEIQEKLCSDVRSGQDQCYNFAELHESALEKWFFKKRSKNIDLFEYLCINKLKVCCPNNTYGPDCIPCPGGIETPCGGHGKCREGGTREEPASCICDAGYTGVMCDACKRGYYRDISSTNISCKLCDKGCRSHCRGPGPKNCDACALGYQFVPNEGCVEKFHDDENSVEVPGDASTEEESKSKLELESKNLAGDSVQKTEL